MSRGGPGCLYSPSFPEGSFSEIGGSKPLDQHTTYSEQSRVTLGSCCLLPGHSHTCCENSLRGATACCSPVARDLVLCSHARLFRRTATQDFRHRERPVRTPSWMTA